MHTSDFLLVVPPGWQEVANATEFVAQHGEGQLLDFLNSGMIGSFDALLGDAGYVPEGKTVSEIKMFKDAGDWRIWFTLIDIPA